MIFRTFGPFKIPLDEYRNVSKSLEEFWQLVENEKPFLRHAKGCYVFGIKTSGGSNVVPWYVGKTLKDFDCECFTPSKRLHFSTALSHYKRAIPSIFLVARLTTGGALFKGNGPKAIDFLEKHLISLGLSANKDLLNKSNTKMYREVKLRGVLNSDGQNMDYSAKQLRASFRLKS